MSQPKTFLLQILVGVNPPHNILSYLDPTLKKVDPLSVNVGDEVGFLVQFVLPNGRQQPACTITFNNSDFFGVTSVDVPAGTASEFLRVRSISGNVKYSLNMKGLGTILDPEIQSGGGPFGPYRLERVASQFVFTWNVGGQSATYTQNGNRVSYDTQVNPEDKVEFVITNAGGAPQDFTVTFPLNPVNPTHWASPFDLNTPSYAAAAATPTIVGPKLVRDMVDTGNQFSFTASVTVNGQSVSLPANINPHIQL